MGILSADKHFERFEDVTPKLLRDEDVRLLLCDLDNTLRLHSEKEPAAELAKWISACKKAGVQIVVISNNGRKRLIKRFCQPLGVDCVWWAKKPICSKLTKTMKKYHCNPNETVMLGDKWSTDVLAAKFARMRAWQVEHRRNIV